MEIRPHFSELLTLLEDNKVEYVIVGGYAMAYHGYPRFTKDIDIFYRNTPENIIKIRKALIEFGFNDNDLPESIFSESGNIIQFGVVPLRVDIINEIEVNFIGRIELIKNKMASGRDQDLLDAKKLEKNGKQ
jgi:hypothetical protein